MEKDKQIIEKILKLKEQLSSNAKHVICIIYNASKFGFEYDVNCANCKHWRRDEVHTTIGMCKNVINLHEYIKKSEKDIFVKQNFIPAVNVPLFTPETQYCSSYKKK